MSKPKYKLGDMIRCSYSGKIELITEVLGTQHWYKYRTILIEGDCRVNPYKTVKCELHIGMVYDVIGNIFDNKNSIPPAQMVAKCNKK